jgi:hypothetical protein
VQTVCKKERNRKMRPISKKLERRTRTAERRWLTREEINAVDDLRSETVDVPEWGVEVRITQLTFAARVAVFEKEVEGFDPRLRLIAACLLAEDRTPIFSEEELGGKSAEVIARLWKRCVEINGMTLKTGTKN